MGTTHTAQGMSWRWFMILNIVERAVALHTANEWEGVVGIIGHTQSCSATSHTSITSGLTSGLVSECHMSGVSFLSIKVTSCFLLFFVLKNRSLRRKALII